MFKLVALLYFALLREPVVNNNYFLGMHLNLKSFSDLSIIFFFYLLYEWTIFLKIKYV
jgi:hypothetical protein